MPRAKLKTTRNDVVLIKQLANFAVRRKMIRENPLADLVIEQSVPTPQPFWTRDQVEQILAATSHAIKDSFTFLRTPAHDWRSVLANVG